MQDRRDIPWSDPGLLPPVAAEPTWGIFDDKGFDAMPLADIAARIEAGPGRTLWHGRGENALPMLLMRPDSPRPVVIFECPELQAPLIARLESDLRRERRKSGLVFYPLLAITIVAELGLHTFVALPAIFAVMAGAEHIEAWRALSQLVSDPARYLRDQAARARYSIWLGMARQRHRCRTCWMVAAWAAIGIAQLAHGMSSSIQAAGLVKTAIVAEPWRLATAAMLHGSILHFVMNAGAMLALGMLLEHGAHRHLVAAVWLAGAVAGNLLSWALVPATSVGASGGILAVFAFLVVMGYRHKGQLPPDYSSSLARSLVMIAALGLLAWGVIDNAAHAAGAITGALLGWAVFRDRSQRLPLADSATLQRVGVAADAAFVVFAWLAALKVLGL